MKNLIYSWVFVFAFLSSCGDLVQEISWDTESIPQKIIVEGNITTEVGTHPVTLKYTDNYFADNPAKMVSGAILTIVCDDSAIYYAENPEIPGQYEAEYSYSGRVNKIYTLNIHLAEEIDETDFYTARTEIVEGMQIDTIITELYENPFSANEEDSLYIVVFFYGLEPEHIDNYYMLKFYRNGEIITDTINQYRYFSDQEIGINGAEVFGMLIRDEFAAGDTLGVKVYSIPEAYDYFLDGINQISEPGDPFGFSGPLANAIGNINDGGGLGFYFGADVTYIEGIVKDKTY